MTLFGWANQKVKYMTVWDIGVLKLFCVAVGLLIGMYFAHFVRRFETVFILLGVLTWIILMTRFFTVKSKKEQG